MSVVEESGERKEGLVQLRKWKEGLVGRSRQVLTEWSPETAFLQWLWYREGTHTHTEPPNKDRVSQGSLTPLYSLSLTALLQPQEHAMTRGPA